MLGEGLIIGALKKKPEKKKTSDDFLQEALNAKVNMSDLFAKPAVDEKSNKFKAAYNAAKAAADGGGSEDDVMTAARSAVYPLTDNSKKEPMEENNNPEGKDEQYMDRADKILAETFDKDVAEAETKEKAAKRALV